MANSIIIKRGADGNVSSLTPASIGEPIFGTTSKKLYVASGTSAGNFEWVGARILDEDNMASNSDVHLATQQSIKAYIDSNITSQDVDFQTSSGVGSVDLDSQSLIFSPGEGMDITHSGQTISFVAETATDSNLGVASFSSNDFSVSSGAVTVKSGGITNAQLAGSIANAKLANSAITVTDGSTPSNIALGATMTLQGTTDEVEVSQSGGTFTVGLPSNVTISGNLTINGELTSTTTSSVAIGDVNVKLAKTNTANSVDIGMYGRYRTASTDLYKGFFFDQDNTDTMTVFKGTQTEPGNTVDTTATGYALAGIKCASIDGATIDGGTF
tara:strand:- start:595 stop:1578 length:984 start_codon:yes stop_codon:yes gene_type:complete